MSIRVLKFFGLSVAMAFVAWAVGNSALFVLAQAGKTITVCASGCDFAKIQEAIDAAPAGSTIAVQTGSYKENLAINNKQDLTLQGAGVNVVTLDGSAGVTVQSPAISIQKSQKITIQGLQIIKSRRGVHAIGTTGLVLANNSFQNNLRQGILLEQQTEAQLTNNLIQNTQLDKDGKQGQGVGLIESTAVLKGNTITANVGGGIVTQGASAQSGSTITIEQNTISDNALYGVALFSTSTATIDGNTIARNVEEGIKVVQSVHAQITNNQITGNKINSQANCCGFGINLSDNAQVTIQGNTISKNVNTGIILSLNAQATIQGNTISQNVAEGLLLQQSAHATIKQNAITNNSSRGVYISGNSNATLDDNTIAGNVFQGIVVIGSAQATITNNRITDNKPNASGAAGQGIYIGEASRATITNNTIRNSNADGILIGASTQNETAQAEISSNTIQNNRGCGARADNDSGIRITGHDNTISGNTQGQLCGTTSKFPAGFGGGK